MGNGLPLMPEHDPRLLVVDDDPGMRALAERFAQRHGYQVIAREGGHELLTELPAIRADVALLDRNMPELGGLDILRAIRKADPTCQVILMTAEATVDSAIEAVKLGALDYLAKPLNLERLGELLGTVREGIASRRLLLAADMALATQCEFCGMVGRGPAMQELFDLIRRLAPHARTSLITGETGTGKELVARALHKSGPRHKGRYVAFNCAAITESLAQTELFGHARGAFTGAVDAKAGLFEHADGGTLFLDEVGELSLSVQAQLLRVLENGEVQRVGALDGKRIDVRVIAATNRTLADEVAAGRFRQDLYYRLNVVEIPIVPLRDRREDIVYLTAAFVREFAARFGKQVLGLLPGAERLLHNAPWPGNVRELRNVIERACMRSEGGMLSEREVLKALGGARPEAVAAGPAAVSVVPCAEPSPELTRPIIVQALQQESGNRSAAAKQLRISRRALYRRMQALDIS